jgi:hypothetical protein
VNYILRMLGANEDRIRKMVRDLMVDRPEEPKPGGDTGPAQPGDAGS